MPLIPAHKTTGQDTGFSNGPLLVDLGDVLIMTGISEIHDFKLPLALACLKSFVVLAIGWIQLSESVPQFTQKLPNHCTTKLWHSSGKYPRTASYRQHIQLESGVLLALPISASPSGTCK